MIIHSNKVINIDRETGCVCDCNNPNYNPNPEEITNVESITPGIIYLGAVDGIRQSYIIGGENLKLTLVNSFLNQVGQITYSTVGVYNIPDITTNYGITGDYRISRSSAFMKLTNGKNYDVLFLIGGVIITGNDQIGITKTPLNKTYRYCPDTMTDFEVASNLTVGGRNLDCSKINNLVWNDIAETYMPLRIILGGISIDDATLGYVMDSLFSFSLPKSDGTPVNIQRVRITGADNLAVAAKLGYGCSWATWTAVNNVYTIQNYYYVTGEPITYNGVTYSFAILKYNPNTLAMSVIWGNPYDYYFASNKKFVTSGTYCCKGIGAMNNKVFIIGCSNFAQNKIQSNIIVFDLSTDTYTVHRSNDGIKLPIKAVI